MQKNTPFPVPSAIMAPDIVYPIHKPLYKTKKYISGKPIIVEPMNHNIIPINIFLLNDTFINSFLSIELLSFNVVTKLFIYSLTSFFCASSELFIKNTPKTIPISKKINNNIIYYF